MQTAVIIDIIVGAVLAAFVIFGAVRGLFRALAGLLILVIALVGAGYISNLLTEPAFNLLSPLLEQRITERIETSLAGSVGAETDGTGENPNATAEDAKADSATTAEAPATGAGEDTAPADSGHVSQETALRLLDSIGLDRAGIDAVAERVREGLADTVSTIAAAAARELTRSVIYGLLYVLSFLLLTLLLRLVAKAIDLVLELPVLHGANALGGAVIGGVEGVLFVFLAIWTARKLGVTFFDSALAKSTILLRFFAANTPLSALTLLR